MKLCDGAGDCLVLEDREGINWCGCTLVTAKGTRYLGAESWRYVMVHLIDGLNGQGKSAGRIEDDEVRWVLSLAEEHCSLYVADREGGTEVFYWQDRRGALVHAMRLSSNDVSAWIDELRGSERSRLS